MAHVHIASCWLPSRAESDRANRPYPISAPAFVGIVELRRQLQYEFCCVIARFCALAVEKGIAAGATLPSARRNGLWFLTNDIGQIN